MVTLWQELVPREPTKHRAIGTMASAFPKGTTGTYEMAKQWRNQVRHLREEPSSVPTFFLQVKGPAKEDKETHQRERTTPASLF